MKPFTKSIVVAGLAASFFLTVPSAQTVSDISLPAPHQEGGKPLMQALRERQSIREFSDKKLPMQTLSDLLWAAFGINRPDGKRTAPSTRNWQEIEIYVVMQEGAYLYDPKSNTLKAVVPGDLRKATGAQKFVESAPLNLVYVADQSKMKGSENEMALYSGADVGFIGQNVYLFCASEGLATVIRGWLNKEECAKKLNLPEKKKVILSQTVGYPKQ
jgi:SagB-type dehydrogenase family enzyme